MAALGDRYAAEDLTSTVFAGAFEELVNFEGQDEALGGWLFRRARHDLYDYRRRAARARTERLDDVLDEAALAEDAPDPQDLAVERLEGSRVMAALKQLSADQREVLLLRLAAGLTAPEVAATLGKTTGAVKALQHRGLASLARVLRLRDQEAEGRSSVLAGVKQAVDALPAGPSDPERRVAELLGADAKSDDERPTQTDGPTDRSAEDGAESDQVRLHFHAEIEPRIVVNEVSTVVLIVSRHHGQATASEDQAETTVGWPLILEAIGRVNAEVAGRSRVETMIPSTGDPKLVLFDVRGTHVGDGEVWIASRQGQIPLVTLVLRPQIVGNRANLGLAERVTR